MPREQEWVHLDFRLIKKETADAFLVILEDGEEEWIPRSQVSDPEDYAEGDTDGTISVTAWLAEKRGWE
jgi:hypothetical protein